MIDFSNATVQVREDIREAMGRDLDRLRRPGGSLTGDERGSVARRSRKGGGETELHSFAAKLYENPGSITGEDVEDAADETGFPPVVETIGIVARLRAVDRFHEVLGLERPELPDGVPGEPTGEVTPGLKKRRGHVPMPPGAIPFALGLVPAESRALMDLHGPMYMSETEMGDPGFARRPGLNTPQMETVAARVSLINECFY